MLNYRKMSTEGIHNMIQKERRHKERKYEIYVKPADLQLLAHVKQASMDNQNTLVEVSSEFNFTKLMETLLERSLVLSK